MNSWIRIFSCHCQKPGILSKTSRRIIMTTVHIALCRCKVLKRISQPINPQTGQEPLTYPWYHECGRVSGWASSRVATLQRYTISQCPLREKSSLISYNGNGRKWLWWSLRLPCKQACAHGLFSVTNTPRGQKAKAQACQCRKTAHCWWLPGASLSV